MSGQRAIDEGRDGWGSHLAPLEPPCECVVQRTVQSDPACTSDCTAHCTATAPSTGSPSSASGRFGYEHDRRGAWADQPDHGPHRARHDGPCAHLCACSVSPRRTSSPPRSFPGSSSPRAVGEAELTIIDAGGDRSISRPQDRRRAPAGRAARSVLSRTADAARGQHGLDGIVLVAEPGRALNERDVADVTGLDVVATVPVTPGIARTIDAGLLAARHHDQREFRDLRRWLTTQLDPFPSRRPPRRATAPTHPEMAGTDLPVALCARSASGRSLSHCLLFRGLPRPPSRLIAASVRSQVAHRGSGVVLSGVGGLH